MFLPLFFLAWMHGLVHAQGFDATFEVVEKTSGHTLAEVRFPSPMRGRFPANNTVWGHLYLPGGVENPPCVLLLPVMAAPNLWIEQRFVRALLAKRYAVFLLEMPFQFHRRPSDLIPSGAVFLARTPRSLAANFRQAVADARRAMDWLQSSGHVDAGRIGLLGISLGAIVGSTVLSQDDRLRGGVLLLGGADLPSLVMSSSMTRDYVRRSGIQEYELRKAWKGLDPLDSKDSGRGRKIVLINARSDDVIPKKNALRLRDAFPDARHVWLPFGHYTAALHLFWIPRYVASNFRDILLSRSHTP